MITFCPSGSPSLDDARAAYAAGSPSIGRAQDGLHAFVNHGGSLTRVERFERQIGRRFAAARRCSHHGQDVLACARVVIQVASVVGSPPGFFL